MRQSRQPRASAAVVSADKPARRLTVETPLYTVGLTEKGAVINSFVLKDYHAGVEKDSPLLNLFPTDGSVGSLDVGLKGIPGLANAVYQAGVADERISLTQGTREIVFGLKLANGMQVEKVYRFSADSYVMGFDVRVSTAASSRSPRVCPSPCARPTPPRKTPTSSRGRAP